MSYSLKTMNKDKQISWQGIFKGLCELYQGSTMDYMQLSKMATELNEGLYLQYPDNEQPRPQVAKPHLDNYTEKLCPVPDCGKPMIRQYNKKNAKAPDWKCSDKNCKFSKAYGGGWKKSEFITGVWDEKPEDRARALQSMGDIPVIDMLEEASFKQQEDERMYGDADNFVPFEQR